MQSRKKVAQTPVDACSVAATVSVVANDKTKPHLVRLEDGSCALVSREVVKKTNRLEAFQVGAKVLCDVYDRDSQWSVVRRFRLAE